MSKELTDAVIEYKAAVEALHTVHGSGDVHSMGGVSTQDITEHCALICGALDARVVPDGKGGLTVVGDANRRFHEDVLVRYEQAKLKLEELLVSGNPKPPAPPEICNVGGCSYRKGHVARGERLHSWE